MEFGELRSILQGDASLDMKSFKEQLKKAYQKDPVYYSKVLIPYMEDFSSFWKEHVFIVQRIEEGEELYKLLPFADMSFYLPLSKNKHVIPRLLTSPFAGNLVQCQLLYLNAKEMESVVEASSFSRLQRLTFLRCDLGVGAAVKLADNPNLPALSQLVLRDTVCPAESFAALMYSSHRASLDFLEIGDCAFDDRDLMAYVESPYVHKLKNLTLEFGNLTDAGAIALSNCEHVSQLQILTLSYNDISDVGIKALAQSPYFESLSRIYLGGNRNRSKTFPFRPGITVSWR